VTSDGLLAHQGYLFAACYFTALATVAAWEAFSPRRELTQPMGLRWCGNISIALLDIVLTRLLFPLLPITLAIHLNAQDQGIMAMLGLPYLLLFATTFCLLDLGIWTVHYLFHRFPLLWRLHAVHHSDPDFDFSTGLRFHPLEAVLSLAAELLIILLLGPPALAVLLYKCVQVFMAPFVHGNLKIPHNVDHSLRKVLVTPDLHRIHHSALAAEMNSNFGGIIPLWDRLFGTYVDQPEAGHDKLQMGLYGMQTVDSVKLHRMLMQPFRLPPGNQPTVVRPPYGNPATTASNAPRIDT
jgi:sterol desaturase/sphingolipid hydroxylase (fatty acid hydroxylase superfamily)